MNAEHEPAAGQERALRDLAGLCRNNHMKLLVVNIPELRELNQYLFEYATRRIGALALEAGAALHDLMPDLKDEESRSLWVSDEDPHASGTANGIIAKSIHGALAEGGMLR